MKIDFEPFFQEMLTKLDTINNELAEIKKQLPIGKQKLYSINEASKVLNRHPQTVKGLVEKGLIRVTPDRKITADELNRYLGTLKK